MALTDQLADFAQHIVDTLTQTKYVHKESIDPEAGVYDCDCNGFCGYVLEKKANRHFGLIPKEAGQIRPRAFKYFEFFASLTPESAPDWRRVDALTDARRGDIVAWRFAKIETHVDTGHVVVLAETPTIDPSGEFYAVRVYDSAIAAHFDDTRAPASGPPATGTTGVGSGVLRFKVDAEGRPIAYLFSPPASAQYSYRLIAIGRAL